MKDMLIDKFLGNVPDIAAELFVEMYENLFSGESTSSVARSSYASAVIHAFSFISCEIGIKRTYSLLRAFEKVSREDWAKKGDVIFVCAARGRRQNPSDAFRRRNHAAGRQLHPFRCEYFE